VSGSLPRPRKWHAVHTTFMQVDVATVRPPRGRAAPPVVRAHRRRRAACCTAVSAYWVPDAAAGTRCRRHRIATAPRRSLIFVQYPTDPVCRKRISNRDTRGRGTERGRATLSAGESLRWGGAGRPVENVCCFPLLLHTNVAISPAIGLDFRPPPSPPGWRRSFWTFDRCEAGRIARRLKWMFTRGLRRTITRTITRRSRGSCSAH
jgi:hypothetical protein